jgi:DNA-binding LacI/PurR family transcriptional regulator
MRELLYIAPRRETATGVIGLLVPELGNPIFPALVQAIESRAVAHGLASIFCHTTGSAEKEVEQVHMLLDHRVDGMIFISCEMTNLDGEHAHYARLMADGARLVFVNGVLDSIEVPSVGVDERAAGELATRHLIELGHQRIGFVAGPSHYLPTRQKATGRERALRAAGLEPDGLVTHGEFNVDGGRSAIRSLLGRDQPPTAVICSSDLMAIGVMTEAVRLGVRVPDELSIVGFDGVDAADWTYPLLTTVEQPIDEIAETAVTALKTLIDEPGRPLPHYVFRPRLRLGGSTAPPA